MKKLVVLVFGIMLVFPMVVNAAFSDVAENHWAYPYITELSEKGIINGMTKDTYVPSGTLTKGQYIKLIISASLPTFISPELNPNAFAPFIVAIFRTSLADTTSAL